MKSALSLPVAVAAALFAATAGAQLKLPRDKPAAAASAAQAPAAAPASQAKSDTADKEAAGKLAAGGWLTLLDRRDWGRSWDTASTTFRTSVPLATWMDNLPKVREDLGALVERIPAESSYKTVLPGQPPGEYVTAIFLSKFEKKEVQEVVTTLREPDGRWRVTGYLVR